MDLHEFQAKEILSRYAIPIPKFGVARTIEDIDLIIDRLRLKKAVIKIQVHAGGRGKKGGVQFAQNRDEIRIKARNLLGMKLVNEQTGPEGVIAYQVLLAEPIDIQSEYYLGVTTDRENATAILIASSEGGIDIEDISKQNPEKVIRVPIELNGRIRSYHLLKVLRCMGWDEKTSIKGSQIIRGITKAFVDKDAALLEINPLALTSDGNFWAVDAKLSIDDNALFRQKELAASYDFTQMPLQERKAKEHNLSYIALQGNIGCMVNGAGLAMATMDIIRYYGGLPANFLDVGGGASKEKVAAGFEIILQDSQVKVILVNIFGGIMNCATLAEGIIFAASKLHLEIPVVVRLEGTNVEQGRKILTDSKFHFIAAANLTDAAKKAISLLEV